MKKVIYKTDCFRSMFKTVKGFNEELQAMLDKYSSEGWLLHSFQVPMGEFCTLVFYKEIE